MKVLFRADSSHEIGWGHIRRCAMLAKNLQNNGHDCHFATTEFPGNAVGLLEQENFKISKLAISNCDYKSQFEKLLAEEKFQAVIIDHYKIGKECEQFLKREGLYVIVIDDIFREHVADITINPNYIQGIEEKLKNTCPAGTRTLAGLEYNFLASTFYRKKKTDPIKEIKNIMVFFGGTDPKKQLIRTSKIFSEIKDVNFHFVVSKAFTSKKELQNIIHNHKNFYLHFDIEDMPSFLNQMDLYFGSGGTITWERFCIGIPGPIMTIAENQIETAESLNQDGLAKNIGYYENVADNEIITCLKEYLSDLKRVNKEKIIIQGLFKKNGIKNIENEIESLFNSKKL